MVHDYLLFLDRGNGPKCLWNEPFADGGLMSTKPTNSSNYVYKMSDYKKGDWDIVWDGLFGDLRISKEIFIKIRLRMLNT